MNFAWRILDIEATNGLITQAKYLVTVKNDKTEVSTEGWWHFKEPVLIIPFVDVTEENVISWIDAEASEPTSYLLPDGTTRIDSTHKITGRLEEQLQALTERANNKVVMPWLPQVFTPEI
jgi:hypothetical protein